MADGVDHPCGVEGGGVDGEGQEVSTDERGADDEVIDQSGYEEAHGH